MDMARAQDLCVCPECPTYFDCSEPLAFCLYESGKSSCISVENGCVCGGCPVQLEEGFELRYYCTRGSAAARVGE